ncbi:MAG TPA: maleylpyruvate isomerase family mycothiol-dependent enzyme [Actinomycetes bacterium]|nr:maleylpyruvate isomerase family mycothiol-dependent enzyme [Actinomycetes bacterium]
MASELNYLDHLAVESARFADVLGDVPSSAPVPTCPDWNAEDLLWHLAEVQWFWGTIVRTGLTDAADVEKLEPERPSDRAGVTAFYKRSSSDLTEALTSASPSTPAWTWSTEQSVGFIRRRQAHEALIHRLDAELTSGERTAMDAGLSSDGIDEALRVMYGGLPPWGTITPDVGRTLRLHATDTDDSWLITLARFTGTEPDTGTEHDEPDIHISATDPGDASQAAVSGSAEDLNCWLWHRPTVGPLARSGDEEILAQFDATISPGIN